MTNLVPFARPLIEDDEIKAVIECLESGWLTTGRVARQFEAEFADFIGTRFAIAVNSCTAALHLALEAFGVREGDKVIVPTMTFTATAEVVRYLGADPVFVDIDKSTMNVDPDAVRFALETQERVRAVIPVHFAGLAADMDALMRLKQEYGISILEDAAHALPASWHGRTIGSIGDATAFSFYATKTITTGEGGMLTTNSPEVAKRAATMRLHGIDRDVFDRYTSTSSKWNYRVVAPGFKYNLPDMLAAIGLVQLAKAKRMQERRKAIATAYSAAFAELPADLPSDALDGDLHAWHLYVLKIRSDESKLGRNGFIQRLGKEGIGTSVHFVPLHAHPFWRDHYGLHPQMFPVASALSSRIVSLPIYPAMTDQDVDKVISATRRALLGRE